MTHTMWEIVLYITVTDINIQVKGKFMRGKLICYCYNYTDKDIEKDLIRNGRSLIADRIKNELKNKQCNCEVKNPKGR